MSLKKDLTNIKENKTQYNQKKTIQAIELTYIIKKNAYWGAVGGFFSVSELTDLEQNLY